MHGRAIYFAARLPWFGGRDADGPEHRSCGGGSRGLSRFRGLRQEAVAADAAARRRGRAGRPEGRPRLQGGDRNARRLRQRRDPTAGRGLPPPHGLQGRLPGPLGRSALPDRPPAVPGRPRPGEGRSRAAPRPRSPTRSRRWPATGRSPRRTPSASRSSTTPIATERTGAGQRRVARAPPSRRRSNNLDWTKVTSPDRRASRASRPPRSAISSTPQTVMTTVSQVDPIKLIFPISEQAYMRYASPDRAGETAAAGVQLILLATARSIPHRGQAALRRTAQVDVKTGTITLDGRLPESREPPAPRPVRQGARRDGAPQGRPPRPAARRRRSSRAATWSPSWARQQGRDASGRARPGRRRVLASSRRA